MEIRCNFKSNTFFPWSYLHLHCCKKKKKAQFKPMQLNKVLHATIFEKKIKNSPLLVLVWDTLGPRGRFSCISTHRAGMGAGSCRGRHCEQGETEPWQGLVLRLRVKWSTWFLLPSTKRPLKFMRLFKCLACFSPGTRALFTAWSLATVCPKNSPSNCKQGGKKFFTWCLNRFKVGFTIFKWHF